ncbi:MAG: beta-lactamase family protein [Paracoccaceae bacterium]|nr:beta-lactamase family protein [Paracoccaceae bacterium]
MTDPESYPNPDLTVGDDNKQGWNQPRNRRAGFHNAHLIFRRCLMMRSRRVLKLSHEPDEFIRQRVARSKITKGKEFSALVVADNGRILFESHAKDFGPNLPHSIQSVTKMHIHLIMGQLISEGLVQPDHTVAEYLPWIGTAYAAARVGQLLDMDVANDFSEDYDNPDADCYTEEEALGWRLPDGDRPEISLKDFAAGLTGSDPANKTGFADYKSANTDILTLIAASVSPIPLSRHIEAIVDAAGYEGSFHISLSPEGHPAFSGGGCLGARDLARFGLLLARGGQGVSGGVVGAAQFTALTLSRPAPQLSPTRPWMRYSNHVMTNGRWLGHAGYGGQFLMVDMKSGRVAAYLSVLENDSGYDEAYMCWIIRSLETILAASG